MVNFLLSYFKRLKNRFHRHYYIQVGYISHMAHAHIYNFLHTQVITGKIMRCSCGSEYRKLTEAGEQQFGWGEHYLELIGIIKCDYNNILYYNK